MQNRRTFLKRSAAATVALATAKNLFAAEDADHMRFALCNETFYGLKWPQSKIFEETAKCGYQGTEIAPFTINTDITKVTAGQRTALRRAADKAGVKVDGLHWILSKTKGLHLTTADRDVRKKTALYLGELARFCAELGGDVMIFGSPKQRSLQGNMSMEEGFRNAVEVLQSVTPVLEQTGVTIAMEPLSTLETNFLNTSGEAVLLAERVDSPYVKMMLDCKAMWATEPWSIPELIRMRKNWFVHFHANDPNLQGPGFGALDFVPIFKALREINYKRWVSVEVFDYSPGPERLASESIKYMKACLKKSA